LEAIDIARKHLFVDTETGETLEREKNGGRWWMAEVAAGKVIGTHKDLTDLDRSLLWVRTSYLTFGNWIKVKQYELAVDMESSPEQISRSIKRLFEAEVIRRKGNRYKLNPMVGTMGSRRRARVDNAKAKGWQTIEGGQ
jgi:hypothetical protein